MYNNITQEHYQCIASDVRILASLKWNEVMCLILTYFTCTINLLLVYVFSDVVN